MKSKLLQGTSGDAILLMLIKMMTMVLGLAITRLLSQHLSIYDYGTYSQIQLMVSTLSSLTIMGMMDGMNFFYCSERDVQKREAYVATLFALQCIVSVVAGSILLFLTEPLCAHFDNAQMGELMIFAAVLPFLQNLLFMFQVLLVSVGKARMLAIRNLIVSLVRLAVVILVVRAVQEVAVVLLTTVLLDVAQIGFFWWTLRRSGCMIRIKSVDFRLFRRIFQYCAPMAVFITVKALNRDIDKYLIALLTDTETLAVYANASKSLPIDIIMHSFYTVLVPEVTRLVAAQDDRGATALYKVFLELAYISNAMICCALLAASPQVMELFYSEKYLSGIQVFCVYILVDMLQFTNVTLILSAAGKTGILMLLGGGSLLMNAVLNVVFYRWMGIVGPAAATLVTTLVMGVALMGLSAKELHTKLHRFFDMKYLIFFAAQNVAAVFLFSMLQGWLVEQGMHYFPILVIVCGAYCGVMLLLHGKRLLRDLRQLNEATAKGK